MSIEWHISGGYGPAPEVGAPYIVEVMNQNNQPMPLQIAYFSRRTECWYTIEADRTRIIPSNHWVSRYAAIDLPHDEREAQMETDKETA